MSLQVLHYMCNAPLVLLLDHTTDPHCQSERCSVLGLWSRTYIVPDARCKLSAQNETQISGLTRLHADRQKDPSWPDHALWTCMYMKLPQ